MHQTSCLCIWITHSPLAAQLASFSAHVKCSSRLINSVAACLKKPPCALCCNLRAGGHQVCNCSMITKVNQCTFGRLRPYLHIMAALSTMAIGFALSWPAISGAEPCTCIHSKTIVACLCLSCQLRGGAEASVLHQHVVHKSLPAFATLQTSVS